MSLADPAYALLRGGRSLAYRAASVIDTPVNVLNGRRPFPPIYLRRGVGALSVFEASAAAMNVYLKLECGLSPESRMLDIGCGCGASALDLRDHFTSGSYTGIDVDARMIAWCERHLAGPKFHFAHHPYWNGLYNPAGERFTPFPVGDSSADVVLMKSVFTHMLPEDVTHYIGELGRVLAPGARGIVTAFVYSDARPRDDEFPFAGDGFKHAKQAPAESKLALPDAWLVERFDEAGIDATFAYSEYQDHIMVSRR